MSGNVNGLLKKAKYLNLKGWQYLEKLLENFESSNEADKVQIEQVTQNKKADS
jgi:hypothetical protein